MLNSPKSSLNSANRYNHQHESIYLVLMTRLERTSSEDKYSHPTYRKLFVIISTRTTFQKFVKFTKLIVIGQI